MGIVWARVLVFTSSAAVLVLEILAGRLMAPYLGVSLETFTGIIGVVLAGIAAGTWLGGWAADRTAPRPLLGPALIVSGVLALVAPLLVDLLGPSLRAGGAMEIVALTTVAFFLPALTLSTVPPIVVKIRLQSLDETGTVVGSFSAISTLGALVGTFVTGFVLIAAVPTRPLVLVIGVLLVVGGLPLVARSASVRRVAAGLLLAVVAAVSLGLSEGPCDTQTTYFCARVEVDPLRPEGRTLWLDTLRHSYVDLSDPTTLRFRYIQAMADVIEGMPEGPLAVAYLGGGGFTLPRYVPAVRPGSTGVVFEIDRALVELVEAELGLVLSDELRVDTGDARLRFPDHPDGSFDVVVGDAFGGLSVPWHLTTVEFVREVDRLLADGGLYVVNVIDFPPLGFARAEVRTLQEVFPHVAVIAPPDYLRGEDGGNYVLVGSHHEIDRARLQARLDQRIEYQQVWVGEDVDRFVGGAGVLRDDFAPVDQLLGRP